VTATVQRAEVVLPSPDGFCRMADLAVGDEVFTAAGHLTPVVIAEDLGELSALSMTFCDGANAIVDPDHLWYARDAVTGSDGVYRTADITANLALADGSPRWSIPLTQPIQFPARSAPAVDPFVFGEELRSGLVESTDELLTYLTAAIDVRCEVLDALLGDKRALPASAPALATAGFASLLRSLGGVVDFERVGFGWRLRARFGGRREIMSVAPAGEMQCRAITVADPSGLYVIGGDFVLTRGGRCS
jgi:hypothetical protein